MALLIAHFLSHLHATGIPMRPRYTTRIATFTILSLLIFFCIRNHRRREEFQPLSPSPGACFHAGSGSISSQWKMKAAVPVQQPALHIRELLFAIDNAYVYRI
jgi:hypothetical protein